LKSMPNIYTYEQEKNEKTLTNIQNQQLYTVNKFYETFNR
jgi:hypothetical protein